MASLTRGIEIKNRPDSAQCNSREDLDIMSVDEEKAEIVEEWGKDGLDERERFGNCLCQTRNVGIRRIAIAQICLAIISIIISAFMLACSRCETEGDSAGSGLWCPVFFLLLGAMCLNVREKSNSPKTICIFGITASYFAVLLFAIKTLELTYAVKRKPIRTLPVVLHIILCSIAVLEFSLIIAMIYFHMKSDKRATEVYKSLETSAEDEQKRKIIHDETANEV